MAIKARGIMNFFKCSDNLWKVKNIVDYFLRHSLAATFARKYKTSIKKIFLKYGKDFAIKIDNSDELAEISKYPSKFEIHTLKAKFINNLINYKGFKKHYFNAHSNLFLVANLNTFDECIVIKCNYIQNIQIHQIWKLAIKFKKNLIIVSFESEKKKRFTFSLKSLQFSLKKKIIPLCKNHQIMLPIKLKILDFNQ